MTMPRWTGKGTFGLADLIDSQAPKSSQEFRYKFALNIQGALRARDAHMSIHFSLGRLSHLKKKTTQVQLNGFSGSIIFSYFAS